MCDIFTTLNYTEDRRVAFATFQFEGAARSWWSVVRNKWERDQTPWNWENFKREFDEKFLPSMVQEKREEEFIKLKQGTLSVTDYEAQFTKLAKFVPEFVATDQRRIRRFVQGLNVEIKAALAAVPSNTFTEVLEKALRIESSRLQVRAFHAKKRNLSSVSGSGTVELSAPAPKAGRGIGGIRTAGLTKGSVSRGASSG
ncbi:hypothetical protein BSCH_00004c [Candidatus Paraburkholderia schumanniana]|nr:hypothetical protein BSCH_00004c [Candidatus Paraburkholderia schumannianae]